MNAAKLVTITIEKSETGLFVATSPDEPGFFLAVTSAPRLALALPLALEDFFRSRQEDVLAFPIDQGDLGRRPWAIVPKALLAKGAERAPFQDRG